MSEREDADMVTAVLLGEVVGVEEIDNYMLVLVYANGKRVHVSGFDDGLTVYDLSDAGETT